jgi:hypothetical protein
VRGQEVAADKTLDLSDVHDLVRRCQGYGSSGFAGAAGATDSVDVILGLIRKVKVDYERDLLDVDAAGRDVRRHEHTVKPGLKAVQRGLALRQRAIRVKLGGRVTHFANLLGYLAGPVTGAGEHKNRAILGTQQVTEKVELVELRDKVKLPRREPGSEETAPTGWRSQQAS